MNRYARTSILSQRQPLDVFIISEYVQRYARDYGYHLYALIDVKCEVIVALYLRVVRPITCLYLAVFYSF